MHRRLAIALLALVCNSILVFPIAAQEPVTTGTATTFPLLPQQQQVSFDYNGKLMRLTWEFEKQFAILRSYPYLHEARLFQAGDTAFTLEATHIVDGKVERELKPLTMQEVSRIRYETSDALKSFAMWGNEERTAVWEDWALGTGVSLWGLGFGALTDSYYTQSSLLASSRAWWITPIAITGSYLWAVNQPWYNRASATFFSNGLWQGTAHGWALSFLFADLKSANAGDLWLTSVISGGVEAGVMTALGHLMNTSTAQAHLITSFGSTGLYISTLALALGLPPISSVKELASFGSSVLACSAAGMWIGAEVGKSPTLTGGDAIVLTIPSNALSATSLVFLNSVRFSSPTPVIAGISIGTSIGGHFLGSLLVQEKDFSFLQGRIINLASGLGGFLPGYFLNNIAIQASFNGQSAQVETLLQISAVAGVLGGIAGFTIPYLIYAKEAEEQHQRRLAATGAQAFAPRTIPHEVTWWENLAANTDVQFSPLGLLPLVSPASVAGLGLGAISMGLPIMSIRTVLGSPVPKPISDNELNEQQ